MSMEKSIIKALKSWAINENMKDIVFTDNNYGWINKIYVKFNTESEYVNPLSVCIYVVITRTEITVDHRVKIAELALRLPNEFNCRFYASAIDRELDEKGIDEIYCDERLSDAIQAFKTASDRVIPPCPE